MAGNTRLKLKPLAAAFFSLASASGLAQAQARPEQVMPEVKVEGTAERADGPVEGYRATRSGTFTKTDTPLKDVPASVSVVPGEVMRDSAMQSMGDAIRYVPGATMHQGEGNRDQVVLRGNSTTADFFVDGVRDDAQVFRDLYNLERIEVLKGPGGMAFGRGGAGGVVNRVTKVPVFEPITAGAITAGSWGQLRGTFDLGNKLSDSAAWRLNGMLERGDSFRNGFHLERYALNPTATLVLGSQTSVTLGFEHLWDYRTADRGFPSASGSPFNADRGTFFGNADQSHARNVVDGTYAVLNHDFGGGLQLKNTTRLTHYDKYYQNVFAGSAVAAATNTLSLSAYNNANSRTNVFNQTDLIKKFSAGGMEHTLLLGAEVGTQDSTSVRNTGFFGATTSATVSASNPFAVATSFRQNGTDANNNVKADVAALYLQDQIAFTKQWKAIVGLRYDHFKVSFDDRRTLVPATDLARTDDAFSPRAGLIWQPTAASTYYVSYSESFLPSGEQLGLAATTVDLDPETARNYEVGGRWDLRPKLTLSGAVFRTDRNNVRVADPANPGFFVKTGQLRSTGFELGLQGEVTQRWQVYGGYSNLNARALKAFNTGTTASATTTVGAGTKLGLVPEHTFSLWNRFDLADGWGAGLGVIYQGASYTTISNAVTLPAFTRADAALFYTFSDRRTRLAVNVENLFDRKYFPTADNDNNISPGAPRTLRVTLSTSF